MRPTLLSTLLLAVLACRAGDEDGSREDTADSGDDRATGDTSAPVDRPDPPEGAPNVLVLLLDDMGRDATSAWDDHPDPPPTPTLEALAEQGVAFDAAWSTPVCSPSRAALLTGRHPERYGILTGVRPDDPTPGLPADELTLAEALRDRGYWTAFFGKWHLASLPTDGLDHPATQGFDRMVGTVGNLTDGHTTADSQDYFSWEALVDGELSARTGYATTATVDDALDGLATLPEPWFVHVSFHAAHSPFHVPPSPPGPAEVGEDDAARFRAMVQALDTELGRLLDAVDLDETLVIVAGDNGTPPAATVAPWDPSHAKRTAFEGGVGVPLIVAGPGVLGGRRSDVPVHLVDLFPTVLGRIDTVPGEVSDPPLDGVDLGPLLAGTADTLDRSPIYTSLGSQYDATPVLRAVRESRWKLIRLRAQEALFDLDADPLETSPVAPGTSAEADAAYDRLGDALDAWREAVTRDGPAP